MVRPSPWRRHTVTNTTAHTARFCTSFRGVYADTCHVCVCCLHQHICRLIPESHSLFLFLDLPAVLVVNLGPQTLIMFLFLLLKDPSEPGDREAAQDATPQVCCC